MEPDYEQKLADLHESLAAKDNELQEVQSAWSEAQQEVTRLKDDLEQAEEAIREYRARLQPLEEENMAY